jgi:S-DNA-T family DNA segregation ATPase FtsK/SpoIIIE
LVYFYYKDSLPDHYYEIAFRNESVGTLSYWFFTVLANFGYWCGIWVTLSFLVFALLHSIIFNKNPDQKNQVVILPLLPLTLCLCYFAFPDTLGEGLFHLISEYLSTQTIALSSLLLGVSVFYLVSEQKFYKFCSWVWASCLELFTFLKQFDYKSLYLQMHSKPWQNLGDHFFRLLSRLYKKAEVFSSTVSEASAESRQQISKRASVFRFKASDASTALGGGNSSNTSNKEVLEAEAESEFESAVLESKSSSSYEADDNGFDEDDSFEEDDFQPEDRSSDSKKGFQETFFDSEELITCLKPKSQSNKTMDPSDNDFTTIARAIEEKLKEFNISSNVINVLKGPVVDTFELELGTGVKVAGVTNRVDDLSLALMGSPIRMVYPMKGKSTIGIEVPRNPRDVIYLDEVLRSPNFNNSSFKLPIAMGKDAYGDAAVIDLASTPHLLVAGTTGAGKSVFINTLLVSLIIKFSPKKLRLIMLDPKQLELALYQRLPHLIMPVVTDASIASAALLWVIDEMERRYSLLKDFAVKNIEGFNKKVVGAGTDLTCRINKYYPDAEVLGFELPYLVVVVDEFADLMLSKSGKAIETSISRLAAKARASGVHIVLATQRPSTDIITGVIKANFPTRVSFRVFTNIDSRVILDGVGAEKLLGKGDMLFKQGIDILRMHSAYVNEDEIEALVDKLSTLPAQYDEGAMEFLESNGTVDTDVDGITTDSDGNNLKDDKYEEAVKCVATHRVASASFLQRRLGVGYNRAANLIEEMERHSVVGPAQGSKPRKVLVPPPADSGA